MTRDLLDVDPVPDAVPAYLHGSQVEYYSCTHQRWLRGVMTLDALDHRVEGYDLGGGLRFPGFSETFDRTIELPRGQTAQISSTWSTCISVSGDCCVALFHVMSSHTCLWRPFDSVAVNPSASTSVFFSDPSQLANGG